MWVLGAYFEAFWSRRRVPLGGQSSAVLSVVVSLYTFCRLHILEKHETITNPASTVTAA